MTLNRAGGVLLAILAAGCSSSATGNNYGNNNNPNPQYPGDPGGAPLQAATVDIVDNQFSPNSVVIVPGGTVTFHWVGTAGHSVTPTGTPTFSPSAGVSYPPKDLVVTFANPGTYNYYCIIHGSADGYGGQGNMIGTVIVR